MNRSKSWRSLTTKEMRKLRTNCSIWVKVLLLTMGAKVETLDVGEITIRSVDGGDDDRQVHYFQKNDSVCVSNDLEMVKLVLARWMLEDGEELSTEFAEELAEKLEKRTFNKNRKFLNVMKQCDGDEDYPPQARLFVDPYELIKATQSGSGVVGNGIGRYSTRVGR